MIKVPDQRKWL